MTFTPKFVDLARNFATVQGNGQVTLGAPVHGYTSIAEALTAGDRFYYALQGVDKPHEREIGRGTLEANGKVAREAVSGTLTSFSSGTKTIALVAAAEWFGKLELAASAGASIEAATREILADMAPDRGPALLTEMGRGGLFVWEPADLSGHVSADTAGGIYIPPGNAPSGASGAWVRQFDGPVNPAWFGVVEGDAAGANGVANSAAVQAMLATLAARAVNPTTYYQGIEPIRFPSGWFELAETIDLTGGTFILQGGATGLAWGRGTVLKFPKGVTAIRIQHHNTSGATATDPLLHRSASASAIRGLYLIGGYAGDGDEDEVHGIHLRARASIAQCIIEGFEGDGIHCHATGGGVGNEGNANNSCIDTCRIQACRNGLFVDGADANIWTVIAVDASSNRQWGICDSSFLGNSYFGCHAADNGVSNGGTPSAAVSHGGNRYGVIAGQEAGASTNAPSGTAADNAWWYYIDAGGVHANFPEWQSGGAYRAGGAYSSDNLNAANVFVGCYAESGQGKAQLTSPTLVVGGVMTRHLRGTGAIIASGAGGYLEASLFKSAGTFRAEGTAFFGSPTGSNLAVNFDNGVSSNTLTFRSTSGTTQTDAALISARNQGLTLRGFGPAGAQGNINLASGTTIVARSKPTGLNVLSGFSYQLNDVQVVGARKTGWATASGTATRTAFDTATVTVAGLAERVKALIDDLHGNGGHGLIGS